MSEIDPYQFGRLEKQVEALESRLDKQDFLLESIAGKLDDLKHTMSEAKGGWKLILLLSGISGGIGAAIVAFLKTFKGG
jgi:hypothetical protein